MPFSSSRYRDSSTPGGYISLEQARILAIQHARGHSDYHGHGYSGRSLTWEIISQEEGEDYYDIRLSFRPAGRFRGTPGVEQFIIDKTGEIQVRQMLKEPSGGTRPVRARSPKLGSPSGPRLPAWLRSPRQLITIVIGLVVWGAIIAVALSVAGVFSGSETALERLLEVNELTVTKTSDTDDGVCDRDCSLREALGVASDRDVIKIPAGTYTLDHGELVIPASLTLAGVGAEETIIQAAIRPDIAEFRVFRSYGGEVFISGVTIRHGRSLSGGGGIRSDGGTLTLTDVSISGNRAVDSSGGGIDSYHTTITLTRSTVKDNTADRGGGISNFEGTIALTDSTISGNAADVSDGGGIWNSSGTLILANSTVNDNAAESGGGGIYNTKWANAEFINSTLSGNYAAVGGGIHYISFGHMTLTNSTVADNRAQSEGGGIYLGRGGARGELVNTIVAGNSAPDGPDCLGEFISRGHNLVKDGSDCDFTPAGGDLVGVDPNLSRLQDNGGGIKTKTHALLPASPAIDAGDDGAAPMTDQRGVPRPQGESSDIGAFEQQR